MQPSVATPHARRTPAYGSACPCPGSKYYGNPAPGPTRPAAIEAATGARSMAWTYARDDIIRSCGNQRASDYVSRPRDPGIPRGFAFAIESKVPSRPYQLVVCRNRSERPLSAPPTSLSRFQAVTTFKSILSLTPPSTAPSCELCFCSGRFHRTTVIAVLLVAFRTCLTAVPSHKRQVPVKLEDYILGRRQKYPPN